MKVDAEMIVEKLRISYMRDAVQQLLTVVDEWCDGASKIVPEVDWSKMRLLDFQESLRSRELLTKRLVDKSCTLCENFATHVGVLPF